MADPGLKLSAKVKDRGLRGLNRVLDRTLGAIRAVFGRKKLEEIVLATMKARFEPRGANRFAQKTPDARPWVPITDYTFDNRKSNKIRSQALVDTGALRDAIQITQDRLALAVTVGKGRARVGIPSSSPEYEKGFRMNEGYEKRGRAGQTIKIPAREFVGVGRLEISAVGKFIDRVFAKVL